MPQAQKKRVDLSRADRRRTSRSRPYVGAAFKARRPHRLRLDSAINEYLSEMRARRSVRAADRMRWLLNDFRRSCPRVYLQAITRRDLMGYMAVLRQRGLADRTIFNRISALTTFL